MQRHMVSDLVERAFAGSASALVIQALSSGRTSPDELREIQDLIERFRDKKGVR
jgi:predicted transcriptional regulator